MDDKIEEILAQYPVQIESRKRIRGAILLETREGQYLLREYMALPAVLSEKNASRRV